MSQQPREAYLRPRVRRYRIVVGIDLSEYADIVLEHALDQAARHPTPELHFLTVREKRKPTSDQLKQMLWERVYHDLEAFNQHGADWRARLHIRRGRPDEQIVMLADEIAADLIVIGQFGLHHPKATDKNLPNRVLQSAGCPTLVVGMPRAIDARMCPTCIAVRETSDGGQWFCTDHASGRMEHDITPLTVWNGGRFEIERAA